MERERSTAELGERGNYRLRVVDAGGGGGGGGGFAGSGMVGEGVTQVTEKGTGIKARTGLRQGKYGHTIGR